jgi:hypothetical protein
MIKRSSLLKRFLSPILCFKKYFCQKIGEKVGVFLLKTKLNYEKNDHNNGFGEKTAIFFAENLKKM